MLSLLGMVVGLGNLHGAENLALGKPVEGTGPTWPGLSVELLTDGSPDTFTHPATETDTTGYYFEVDLGREFLLERIVIRNRNDGCCPERLTRYRVEVYGDQGGESGSLNWGTLVRADGSHSGVGGVDTIQAQASPGQSFQGRYIRVVNPGSETHQPQLAEIEAYGVPGPVIRRFEAGVDTLASGATTRLFWDFTQATSARIEPFVDLGGATTGSAEIRPLQTTVYRLIVSNPGGSVTNEVLVGVDEILAPPELTEFMAANATGLKDEDGDASDWIELRNPNRFGLDVAGYRLTDNANDLSRWRLPSRRIPPLGHLLIFASGKNRASADAATVLHTNFRLDAEGEYLALVAPNGREVLQQYPANFPQVSRFPAQFPDVSYGREPSGKVGHFRPSTPGTTNGPAFDGLVAPVTVNLGRGFYDSNVLVTLANATPGAEIRYTLDRLEPTATRGTVYSGPITVDRTLVLRVAAFRPGWAPTEVVTHTYVLPHQVIASPVMRRSITADPVYGPQMRPALLDLPSLSVVAGSSINGAAEVKASLEWLNPGGEPGFQVPCGVRNFGGAFTDFAKKNFRFYFRSEYGASKLKYPAFAGFERGLAAVDEFDQLDLRSGSHDMDQRGFYLANAFVDDTLLEAGHLNPHGRFVHLYLNGSYWGLYHLRERWGAAMHARYLGGSRTNYESINGNWNVGGWPDPGVPYDGDGSAWTTLKSKRDDYTAARPWLDVPEYIDFMITWMFGGAEDEYRCVGPNVPGSGFKFYLNDADGWFCIPQYCAADNRTGRGSPGRQAGDGPGSLFSMLLRDGDPEYRTLLADRIQAALTGNGVLTPARNAARLQVRLNEMSRAFLAESARWGYLTPTAWAARRDSALNNWIPNRTAEVLSQFRGAGFLPRPEAPALNPPPGLIASNTVVRFDGVSNGSIWYTDDGSDPRQPGGQPSPTARRFQVTGSTEVLVPAGARWKWFTDAVGQGPSDVVVGHPNWSATNWKHPNFNDGSWAEGPAQLGYGEGDEATVIPFGNAANKWPTAYFRRKFTLASRADLAAVTLRLKRDDGAIVYLNGQELVRSSVFEGILNANSLAQNASDDGQTFLSFVVSPDVLLEGSNTLAVELHQSSASTSDASFDLELTASRQGGSQGELPVIGRNTWIRARTQDGSEWSGLTEGFYPTGTDPLPAGSVLVSAFHASPADSEASEYLELFNSSAEAINLRGARFTSGLEFQFADNRDTILGSGQRLLLVSDLFQFQRIHGIDVPVAGSYQGRLNDAGETITLTGPSGQTWLSFSYGVAPTWPAEAQNGYSLVLARPELGLSNPLAWRLSRFKEGSPGRSDALKFLGDPKADADQDGLAALLEYALGTSDADAQSGPNSIQAEFATGTQAQLRFRRQAGTDDVQVQVESTVDLVEWSPARKTSALPNASGQLDEVWTATDPGLGAFFLRLRVIPR
ncbi:MAG: CotH kinase family protein [Verrucomicrobia bacterium]|nr:CotH kinase family protein [Verrucomicrobiota bacterium]